VMRQDLDQWADPRTFSQELPELYGSSGAVSSHANRKSPHANTWQGGLDYGAQPQGGNGYSKNANNGSGSSQPSR
jgi:hypothetical protein